MLFNLVVKHKSNHISYGMVVQTVDFRSMRRLLIQIYFPYQGSWLADSTWIKLVTGTQNSRNDEAVVNSHCPSPSLWLFRMRFRDSDIGLFDVRCSVNVLVVLNFSPMIITGWNIKRHEIFKLSICSRGVRLMHWTLSWTCPIGRVDFFFSSETHCSICWLNPLLIVSWAQPLALGSGFCLEVTDF